MNTILHNRRLLFFIILGVVILTGWYIGSNQPIQSTEYYVNPQGKDRNHGTQPTEPFQTLQHALDLAQSGDTIHLADGIYNQEVQSVRDGLPHAPITIEGTSEAIFNGANSERIFEINHNYHTLTGFTIDGLYGDPESANGYRSKLLYVQGQRQPRGVVGLKVLNMAFQNAGGECLRLRFFTQESEVAHSSFTNCGIHDFVFNAGGKNGEAIYIGTSSNQWFDGKNPSSTPDGSNSNWIHHNYFDTAGNECVEIKEGATRNIIEYNTCTGQQDGKSAGFSVRGDHNVVRFNEVFGNAGAAILLGGHLVNDVQYGKQNDVHDNLLYDNGRGAVSIRVVPQGKLCGNVLDSNRGQAKGFYSTAFDMGEACAKVAIPSHAGNGDGAVPLTAVSVSISQETSHSPQNTLDGDLDSYWMAPEGAGQWIVYDLGANHLVDRLEIGFLRGRQQQQRFEIEVSDDNQYWRQVYEGQASGLTNQLQSFVFTAESARFVRIVGVGRPEGGWGLTAVEIYGT